MPIRVTIAYDGSDAADDAIGVAAGLFPGASATVVTVPRLPPGAPLAQSHWVSKLSPDVVRQTFAELAADAVDRARATARAGAEQAQAAGLEATALATPADSPAWERLLAAAEGSDVLVCGSRGRGGMARALLGSTSTSLLHHSRLPLLVVPPGAGVATGPSLLAYDGSEAAAHAIAAAARLLPTRPALVVHVWESPYRHSLTGRALAHAPLLELRDIVDGMDDIYAAAAADVTETGVGLARMAGLEASGATIDSDDGPWRAIAVTAATQAAAVIVVGSRGQGGAHSALLGSVAAGLTHNAELPVLVAPASPAAGEASSPAPAPE